MLQALFATIGAAFFWAMSFLLRSVIVKFGLFFGLWFVTTEFIEVLQSANLLPSINALNGPFAGLPVGVWFWLDFFAFTSGAPLVISAITTRFIIRRIPLIG